MEFAENLKYLRNSRQLTQKELASILGLTANCICEWEKNRSEPSISTIKKIADVFDVSADYLLGLEDDFGTRPPAPIKITSLSSSNYSDEERRIIEEYRKLPESSKQLFRRMAGITDTVIKN